MSERPSETLISMQVPADELIALEYLIYSYRLQLKSMSPLTRGQRELLELLESFQQRVAAPMRQALDLSRSPQPWEETRTLPRFASSVATIGNHILNWASERVVLLKNASRWGRHRDEWSDRHT